MMNDVFLKDSQWVATSKDMSIADLLAYQEIIQMKMVKIEL